MLHVDIPSYEIRMNPNYSELVATIDGIGNSTKDFENFNDFKLDEVNEKGSSEDYQIRKSEDINPEIMEIRKAETKKVEFEDEPVENLGEQKNHYNTPFKIEMSEKQFF